MSGEQIVTRCSTGVCEVAPDNVNPRQCEKLLGVLEASHDTQDGVQTHYCPVRWMMSELTDYPELDAVLSDLKGRRGVQNA